jgi:hypothetical protein
MINISNAPRLSEKLIRIMPGIKPQGEFRKSVRG